MDDLTSIPTAVWVVLALAALGVLAALVDLARHDVRHLPKLAWAAIVVLVSFPIGASLYLALGRVPRGENAPLPDGRPTQAPSADAAAGGLLREPTPPARRDPAAPELREPASPAVATLPRYPDDLIVRTSGLGKDYGDTWGLRGVDLAVPRGATYGLIGPNGAGKTTMLSILSGLRRPTEGEFHLDVPRSAVGVVVDTPQFEPWLTAHEVIDLARALTAPELPAERVDDVLRQVGLADAVQRRVGGFSRGMLQRLGLAAGLVGDPQLLILDEPSSALDPAGRREVLDLIGRLAHTKTVLLSTHILADVQQVCDVVGVIDRGELRFQGPLAELLARPSAAYSIHVGGSADGLLPELRARPWVQEVAVQAPGRLRVVVHDATQAEAQVPALLAAAGAALVSFNPATDLESAFLELTS
jgi:ABC-2 type transport system ATP-binding protein